MNRYAGILATITFFGLFLVLGLRVVDDYGISFDEAWQRDYGYSVLQYIGERVPSFAGPDNATPLHERQNRFHGPLYTTIASYLELQLEPDSLREAYFLRHRVGFVLFWLAGVFVFAVGRDLGKHWAWGIFAAALLYACPRLFAHAFFNPKDLPNLAFYTYAGCSLYFIALKPSWLRLAGHAALCGMAIAMRLTSILLPVVTIVIILWPRIVDRRWPKGLLQTIAFLGLTFGSMVLCWPTLWESPLRSLGEAFEMMSAFPWDGQMLVANEMVRASALPVWYLPVWIGVTIPIAYQILSYAGLGSLIRQVISRFQAGTFWSPQPEQLAIYTLVALGFGPLLLLIIMNPNMYNGWRHSYFTYPFMMLLGIWWLAEKFRTTWRWRWALAALVAINMISVIFFMVNAHPHQQTYFNFLAGKNQLGRYNIDYWGLSYRQGFECLGQLDGSDTLYVKVAEFPGHLNHQILPDTLRQRIILTDKEEQADYYLTHYWYWHDWRADYREKRGLFGYPLVDSIDHGNTHFFGIYQLKGNK